MAIRVKTSQNIISEAIRTYIWEGASFPTTFETDMILGLPLIVAAGLNTLPVDPDLENDVDKWHDEWLFGSEQPEQNDRSLDRGKDSSILLNRTLI